MTREDTAALALRLLAIYLLFRAFEYCLALLELFVIWRNQRPGPDPLLGTGLAMVLLGAFGLALYAAAPDIARRIFPGNAPTATASAPELGVLAFKLMGFVMLSEFVLGLSRLPEFLRPRLEEWERSRMDAGMLALACRGVGAAVLLGAAPWLARRLFGPGSAETPSTLPERVQPVAFSVLGLWIFVPSLLAAGQEVAHSLYRTGEWDAWRLGTQSATAVLGLALFVGGGALARVWRWMQVAGLRDQPPA